MKKSLIVYVVIFLIVTLIFIVPIIGGYFILNDFFPKADPINCPAAENIQSVSLSGNDEHTVLLNETDYEELLHNISNSLPTRNMPMNDYPAVRQYYTITIQTSVREYRYFVYEEDSQVYIELPYEGIYRSENKMLDFVLEHYRE